MKNPRKFMEKMEFDELKEFAVGSGLLERLSEAELEELTKPELIDILMEDDGEGFSEAWEMANEDCGDAMHPDEDDDEFFSHEDPDKG